MDVFEKGGIVLGFSGDLKTAYINDGDTHTLCIGSTRCGKSRTVVIPSVAVQALAGENILCSDPKGELHQYTYPFLQRLGYHVHVLDFKNPRKSDRFNFLQPVIDAAKANDSAKAIRKSVEITESIVGEAKGERIWSDGEKAVMGAAILSVVCDNIKNPKVQNMTNVYYFIAEMCKMGDEMLLEQYLKDIPPSHPARALLAAAEVGPSRTKASFYISALSSLRLFTDPNIHSMTSGTDININGFDKEKTAVFIILPDETTAYYSLASIFVNQIYVELVTAADKRGGRLERRFNYNLDEFGNFTVIPDFAAKLTVGGGRGIRFNLFLQSLTQLKKKYGEEDAKTIEANCEYWLYLRSEDLDTRKLISEKLGTYTCETNSRSSSYSGTSLLGGNQSASANLQSRALLTPDEVGRIARPFQLVMSRNAPAITYAPDLSKLIFNSMLGLGDEEHNRLVRLRRENARTERGMDEKLPLWGIWEKYREEGEFPPYLYEE